MDRLTHRFLHQFLPKRFSIFPALFSKRYSSTEEIIREKERNKLLQDLNKRIAELKQQLVRNRRHTYLSRSAKQSLTKLQMAILEMKEQEKRLDGQPPAASVPSFLSLEILSNGTAQSNPSCFIRTPFKTYMFNCPEGTSRLMMALRIKPQQLNDIFVTRATWDDFGGLNSFLLSREGKGEAIRIHSSVGIRQYFDCIRPFADSDTGYMKYPVRVEERSLDNGCYIDPAIKVHYLPLIPSCFSSSSYYGNSPPPHSSFKTILRTDVAFLIELTEPPRRINAAKLIELGIPNGPHIAMLKDGLEVTVDGRLIKPDEVLFPREEIEQPTVLIVECSGPAYFPSLCENSLLQEFMNKNRSLNYCVHFTPEEMFKTPEYAKWMNSFGDQCKHIVLNGSGPSLPHLEGVHRQQTLMRSIAPFCFSVLSPEYEGIICQDDECEQVGNLFYARPLQRFILRGRKNSGDAVLCNLSEAAYTGRDLSKEAISKIENFKKLAEGVSESDTTPALLFLGTASANPSKYRNVSSQLLKIKNDSYILIDCGEGTYGQMRVQFGEEKCNEVLLNLHAVFITHAHMDHVNGLYSILLKRKAAFTKKGVKFRPAVIVCCPNIMRILDFYCRAFSDLHPLLAFINLYKKMKPKPTQKFRKGELQNEMSNSIEIATNVIDILPKELFDEEKWGIRALKAVQVHHTRMASGYIITLASGHKVVFSGDTKPCQLLAEHGQGADVLVHEATFEDGLEKDALAKKHSTMRQAVNIGLQMKAKYIILTHFSSRYAKVPSLPNYLDDVGNVAVAADNLFIRFKDLHLLPKLIPVYRDVFKDEIFEMQLKMEQQRLKKCQSVEESGSTESEKKEQCCLPERKSCGSVPRKRRASAELIF